MSVLLGIDTHKDFMALEASSEGKETEAPSSSSMMEKFESSPLILMFGFFGILYYLFSLSYRFTFADIRFSPHFSIAISFDYIVDAFFILETAFSMFGKCNPKRSDIFFRLVLIFPWEVVAYAAKFSRFSLFRIVKLFWAYFIPFYWNGFARLLSTFRQFQRTGVLRVVMFFIVFATVAHVGGCLYYSVGLRVMKRNRSAFGSWVQHNDLAMLVNNTQVVYTQPESLRYLKALYWAIQTLVTVGYGDVVAYSEEETWFCIFFFYVSAALTMMAISNLVLLISDVDAARLAHSKKVAKFKDYAVSKSLPLDLVQRVEIYYNHKWQREQGAEEKNILDPLPENIKEKVSQHLRHSFLSSVSFFRGMDTLLLNAIVEHMETWLLGPSDVIHAPESLVKGVCIVASGTLNVVDHSTGGCAVLHRGDQFGATSLVCARDTFSTHFEVRAKSFAEVWYISARTFHACCIKHLTVVERAQLNDRINSVLEGSVEAGNAIENSTLGTDIILRQHLRVFQQFNLQGINPQGDDGQSGDGPASLARSQSWSSHIRLQWKAAVSVQSQFRGLLRILMLCCTIFYQVSTPILLASTLHEFFWPHFRGLLIGSYCVDLVVFGNFVVEFGFLPFIDAEGNTVWGTRNIARHFMSEHNIYLVVLAVLPIDLFVATRLGPRAIPVLRLLKGFHGWRIGRHFQDAMNFMSTHLQVTINSNVTRFIVVYYVLFLMCNWVGCLFLLNGDVSVKVFGFHTNWEIEDRKSETLSMDYTALDTTTSYWRSVYWAIGSMSTVSFPDISIRNPMEELFVCVVIFFGCQVFNMLVGGLSSIVSGFGQDKRLFQSHRKEIEDLVRFRNVPQSLTDRISRYHEYLWGRYKGVDEGEVLADLPKFLRTSVAMCVAGPALMRVPLFHDCSEEMLRALVTALVRRVFLDGDVVITAGEYGKDMYILESGTMRVTSKDGSILYKVLTKGDYVGESSLLKITRSTASVRSVGYSDTYMLSKDGFFKVGNLFPAEHASVAARIKGNLKSKRASNRLLRRQSHELRVDDRESDNDGVSDDDNDDGDDGSNVDDIRRGSRIDIGNGVGNEIEACDDEIKMDISSQTPHLASAPSLSFTEIAVLVYLYRAVDILLSFFSVRSSAQPTQQRSSTPHIRLENIDDYPHEPGPPRDVTEGVEMEALQECGRENDQEREQHGENEGDVHIFQDHEADDEDLRVAHEAGAFSASRQGHNLTKTSREAVPADNTEMSDAQLNWMHPNSLQRAVWDVIMLFLLWYNIVVVPLRLAITDLPSKYYSIDYVFDCLFVVDCLLHWTSFHVFTGGELVTDVSRIRALYQKKRMIVDVMSNIPYDVFTPCFPRNQSLARAALRVPKFLRLSRYPEYFGQVTLIASKFRVSNFAITITQLVSVIAIVAYIVASAFYYLGNHRVCHDSDDAEQTYCLYHSTWVMGQIDNLKLPPNGGDTGSRFLRALNLAIPTLTRVCVGDVSANNQNECLFVLCFLFVSFTVVSYTFGGIEALVNERENLSNKLANSRDVLKKHFQGLDDLASTVMAASLQVMDFIMSKNGQMIIQQEALLESLPVSLRDDVNKCTILPHLKRCPFFNFCSDELLKRLSRKLKLQAFANGDDIVTCGDFGQEMYFIDVGVAHVLGKDGMTVFTSIQAGGFFGESALFSSEERSATIRATGSVCICYCLTAHDFHKEMAECKFDWELALLAFEQLQEANRRRNAAVERNLMIARDPTSKLFKMLQLDNDGTLSPSTILMLRTWLHPTSSFRFAWDAMGLVFLVYYALAIPFHVAFLFGPALEAYTPYLAFDFVVDLYWVLDIALKATLFSFVDNGVLVRGGDRIFRNYRTGKFVQDIVASIPLEIICISPRLGIADIFMFRTIHLIRIYQLFDSLTLVEKHIESWFDVKTLFHTQNLIRSCIVFLLINQFLVCIYFMIHRYSESSSSVTYVIMDGKSTYHPTTGHHDVCSVELSFCYARSLYFVLGTIGSIGYGDITPYTNLEISFEQLVAVIGVFLSSTFCASYYSYLRHVDRNGKAVAVQHLHHVKNFVRTKKLRPDLAELVLEQYQYLSQRGRHVLLGATSGKDSLMMLLPVGVRSDVALAMFKDVIEATPLIAHRGLMLRRRIAAALRPQIALAGGSVYETGFAAKSIFFVARGLVEISLPVDPSGLDLLGLDSLILLRQKERVHGSTHNRGEHFGELCVTSPRCIRADTAVAVSTTELYTLSAHDFHRILVHMSPNERRGFVIELMTHIGEHKHTHVEVSVNFDSAKEGTDGTISSMSSICLQIMLEVIRLAELRLQESSQACAQRARLESIAGSLRAERPSETSLTDLYSDGIDFHSPDLHFAGRTRLYSDESPTGLERNGSEERYRRLGMGTALSAREAALSGRGRRNSQRSSLISNSRLSIQRVTQLGDTEIHIESHPKMSTEHR